MTQQQYSCKSIPTKVSILGAGNAGLTAAFHFTQQGCQVALYGSPGFDQQIAAISENGGITSLSEYGGKKLNYAGFQALHLTTTDLKAAINFSSVLILPVPAFAQAALFIEMLPHLTSGQIIVLMPGNYGSLALTKIKNEAGYASLDIDFVDAISIPWATRITGPAEIAILGMKAFLPVAALPASKTLSLITTLQPIFPLPLTALENVIAAGLENINFGGHPLMTMLNIGLLENFPGKFNFYTDCCSTATANACDKLDQERLAVGDALSLQLKTELDAMNDLYQMNATSVFELNKTSITHGKVNSAPDSAKNRYISEDTPYLLVPCAQLAALVNVDVPIINSVVHITSALNKDNYFESGRTLEKMGLANKTPAEIISYIS